MAVRTVVSIVDDDESVRESLPDLLRSFGFDVAAFASAEGFLASESLDRTSCLIRTAGWEVRTFRLRRSLPRLPTVARAELSCARHELA